MLAQDAPDLAHPPSAVRVAVQLLHLLDRPAPLAVLWKEGAFEMLDSKNDERVGKKVPERKHLSIKLRRLPHLPPALCSRKVWKSQHVKAGTEGRRW